MDKKIVDAEKPLDYFPLYPDSKCTTFFMFTVITFLCVFSFAFIHQNQPLAYDNMLEKRYHTAKQELKETRDNIDTYISQASVQLNEVRSKSTSTFTIREKIEHLKTRLKIIQRKIQEETKTFKFLEARVDHHREQLAKHKLADEKLVQKAHDVLEDQKKRTRILTDLQSPSPSPTFTTVDNGR